MTNKTDNDTQDALTIVPAVNYMVSKFDIEDIGEIIQENLGGEQFDIQSLNKIKVPSGGSKTWTIQTSAGEKDVPAINGVCIYNKVVRVYYAKAFGEGNTNAPPDCYSKDGLMGIGNPGGPCINCHFSQFGSSPDGKKTACPSRRLMFFLMEDSMLPSVLSVPPSGLKDAKKYLLNLSSEGKRVTSVVTQLTLRKEKSSGGIDYSAIEFKELGPVNDPEKFMAYAKTFKSIIENSEEAFIGAATTHVTPVDEEIPF
jgi:hypothetical protein